MKELLVFGGTTEGRELAAWLGQRGACHVVVSSLTEYGGTLVEGLANVESLTGRMTRDRMGALMEARRFACVIDATHPYAANVSESIATMCEATATPLLRVVREGEPDGPWTGVPDAPAAARLAAECTGNVLLTTGSNDLATYVQAIPDYRERLFVRILPVAKSLEAAARLEIPTRHVIAMQGPFSRQLNCALIREFDIAMLVTKASGAAGGFWEKVEAAADCGIESVVIHRPTVEEGVGLEQAKVVLAKEYQV